MILIFTAAVIGLSAAPANEETWKVDTKLSNLEWSGKKPTGEHKGTINLSSGTLSVKDGAVTGGAFEIDMNSLVNKDLTGEWIGKLEGHLKSADFFDVTGFPKAKFEITSVTPVAAGKEGGFTHSVKGNLTIKGKTNEIGFDAVIKIKDGKAACSGTAVVDRSKFDVRYGSKSFFADIGDKIIYDDFTVKMNVVAVK